ncbi:hypothetical protein [Mangrovihabitans endophyticus]|uniref:Uncharacterized protein n=1 Tax=Mangrovihabitans endophyticus TaxID=1751298 RepID=A0A8J3C1B6_9ACTN|nr:hypothetical protein [Mangrovihabitans endophyticus]GGL02970.1 hypothetical protein GCM10012284_42010 [Mangrovihabitans endophyticus]
MTSAGEGGRPHEGEPPDGLPGIPKEWGVIVIPDDLSELADEVRAVQAELHPHRRQPLLAGTALRRLLRAGVRAPVLIVAMAVMVTIASLLASAWSQTPRPPSAVPASADSAARDTLPALELIGSDGHTVPLRGQMPAVVLLTDGCDCAGLITDTITAIGPRIAVVTVSSEAPPSTGTTPPPGATPQAQGKTIRHLRDPTGELRRELHLAEPDGTAAAVLVDHAGTIVRTFPRTASVETLLPDIARL